MTRVAVVWGVLVRVMDNESSFVQEFLGTDADARKEHIPVVLVKKGSRLDSPAHDGQSVHASFVMQSTTCRE